LYVDEEYQVCGKEGTREDEGRSYKLWAEGPKGLAMTGTAVVVG